jgi:hypothetical protein
MAATIPTPHRGETVARAKRTERAEARRRYRAATAPDETFEDVDAEAPTSRQGRSNASSSAPTPPATAGRVGFFDAFRLSIRPMHIRADVAALPSVATHSFAVWVPLLITIVATVAAAVTGARDVATDILFKNFVVFPAIGGPLIAGFLAPRASWLIGGIVGLTSALCYVVLGATNLLPDSPIGFQSQFNTAPQDIAVSAFLLSPIMGAFFAAGGAWYRRFLALMSPNRNARRASQAPKQRPGDGRTRGTQKAGAKR